MKKILMLATAALALPFLTSCADFATYGYGTVGAPIGGGFGGPGFVGGGFAPLQVGFVSTTFDQWAYDPYRRSYFDRRVGRFYDPRLRNYCDVVPHRYAAPIYPTGFRRGNRLACPTFLPRHTAVVRHSGHGNAGVVSNRGRYSPVVHGSSRGSTSIRSAGNYDKRSSGSTSNRRPTYEQSSGSSRYQTVGTSSRSRNSVSRPQATPTVRSQPVVRSQLTVRSQPVVRSQPAVRSQPVRSAPTVRSSSGSQGTPSRSTSPSRTSSPSRSTSTPSRSSGQARQRTR